MKPLCLKPQHPTAETSKKTNFPKIRSIVKQILKARDPDTFVFWVYLRTSHIAVQPQQLCKNSDLALFSD